MAIASKESTGFASKLDAYFSISARGSSFGQEIRGGLTTFLTMVYIVVLNPIIIGYVPDNTGEYLGGGTEPNPVAIATATALIAGVLTIVMGAWARFPLALATGLGLNSFVAYALVGSGQLTWEQAMGLIVLEGAAVLVLVLTKARIAFLRAIPTVLKKAIAAGIGLFLAFIAFWDSGVVRDPGADFDPTPSEFAQGGYVQSWTLVVFFVGLLLAAILVVKKIKGALLYSIIGATVLAFIIHAIRPQIWAGGANTPSFKDLDLNPLQFDTLFKVDLFGAFSEGKGVGFISALLLVFSLLVVDFFDTMGTMTAVGEEAGLNDDEGIPEHSQEVLIVDSIGAIAGGLGGVSSNTAYIESASGVGDGARTGLASIVTGLAFIVTMFLTPIAQVIPHEAATPVLVIVGLMMLASAVDIDWKDYRIAVPAFLTIIVMPFGYSIAAGVGLGFIAYAVINAATGKAKEVKPLMWVAAGAFVVYFAVPALKAWFNI